MTTKRCPFCGRVPEVTDRSDSKQDTLVTCRNENCVIWDLMMGLDDWEWRPNEDNLRDAVVALAEAARWALRDAWKGTSYRLKWVKLVKSALELSEKYIS